MSDMEQFCEVCKRTKKAVFLYEKHLGLCCDECIFTKLELFINDKFNEEEE